MHSGHHPKRDIHTGIWPETVSVPKVRSRQGIPVTFHSALVPAYGRKMASFEAAIPRLYLKGISTGEMQPALDALVGLEAKVLSASTSHVQTSSALRASRKTSYGVRNCKTLTGTMVQ